MPKLNVTRYFAEQVLAKRPYIQVEWCEAIILSPLRRTPQLDGRWRFWGVVNDPRDGQQRILRIVTLEDGLTIHNAFFDRGYEENEP